LRSFLWISFLAVLLVGVLVPALYFRAVYKLPALETHFDLDNLLKPSIEGERASYASGTMDKEDPERLRYHRPDFATLPKELVAFYITELGCPTFFQTPREEGLAWGWRLFSALLFSRQPSGDGWCERTFSYRLADAIYIKDPLERMAAAHRMHRFLQKDQLVAYDLATLRVGRRGIVGVEDISRALFNGRAPEELDLSELAELSLALPPHGYFRELDTCSNAGLMRQARDILLGRLAQAALIPTERMRAAQAEPVSCMRNRH
jgi:hypothetical protein